MELSRRKALSLFVAPAIIPVLSMPVKVISLIIEKPELTAIGFKFEDQEQLGPFFSMLNFTVPKERYETCILPRDRLQYKEYPLSAFNENDIRRAFKWNYRTDIHPMSDNIRKIYDSLCPCSSVVERRSEEPGVGSSILS